MKLRDLAKGSSDPTSIVPAFHISMSRFGNRGAARGSRKSYESVPILSPTPHLLTLLQQTTVVLVLGILCRPCRPRGLLTFHIRSHRGNQRFRSCTCRRPAPPLVVPNLQQSQREAYSETLIAGDLTDGDILGADDQLRAFQVSRL